MIKITRDFEFQANCHYDRIMKDYNLKNLLEEKIKNTHGSQKEFYRYINRHIREILKKDIEYIQSNIIPTVSKILGTNFFDKRVSTDKRKKLNKDKRDEVLDIFNYESFKNFHKTRYNAFDLLENLNINVCPYCNRQYINTIKPKLNQGGTKATLDHFLLKSLYPFLSLSFWNLIPSCFSCNSQLRTSREIGLHPYKNGFDGILKFNTDINDITEFIGDSKMFFNLELKISNKKPMAKDYIKAKLNDNVFRIEDLYQNHKDYVREIIQTVMVYNKNFSSLLYTELPEVFENEQEVKNMMLSNYTEENKLEKRPLSKLTKDIASELGII